MENSTVINPVSIKQTGPLELAIEWSDKHVSFYSTYDLRLGCRCATCVDEWNGMVKIQKDLVPKDVHPETIESVGRYGIKIHWNDGHSTGIYTFNYLREICSCSECKAKQHEEK